MAYGKVIQIIGPVIDCEFAKGEIPKINEAIRIMRNAPVVAPEQDPAFDPEALKSLSENVNGNRSVSLKKFPTGKYIAKIVDANGKLLLRKAIAIK